MEVFTTKEQKIRSDAHAESINPDQGIDLQVYLLDGIQQFESALSKKLPTDLKQAKQIALQRLQHLDAKLMAAMQQAAIGLTKATQYGVDRYPAIVFDGQAVVYGVTDVLTALAYYQAWRREGKR
ncbi:TIGR03757 family integrating conjugative element protein [Candidatus Thiodiazotropha sp. LNASS1]|uniref:TIGR03757 family integrating conjugative element protein n=1 Tax=Candidatus Thiodiazotropha sp. LNASS1 TaxID=3096260 RepID=UPI0034847881